MQAYVDDSESQGEVLVLGGLVATPERWKSFSEEWQGRLDAAPWARFKMSEVWDRGGEIPLEHAKWHYFTLRKFVQGAITMVVPIEPLKRIALETSLMEYANPYIWAIKGIINCTAQEQRAWGFQLPIDFTFDNRGEENQVRDAWEFYQATIPPAERSLTGRKPMFTDDEDVLPLQAADMWAWWARRKWLEKRTVKHSEFPIPWGELSDLPSLAFEWTEVDIRKEFTELQICKEALQKIRH